MNDILRDSAERDRRNNRRLGLICIAAGLAVTLGFHELSAGAVNLLSLGTIGFGVTRLFA